MDKKIEELIAVGASVTANCVPCVKYHVAEVRKAGATDDEIRKAISVGRLVRKGAASSWDRETASLFESQETPSAPKFEASCGVSTET